jgi:hypothetical protein
MAKRTVQAGNKSRAAAARSRKSAGRADRERSDASRGKGQRSKAGSQTLTGRGGQVTGTLRKAGDAVRGAGDTVVEAVTANPIPAALIGAGVAWLLVGNRVRGAASYVSQAASESELLERARSGFDRISEGVSSRLSDAAETFKDAFDSGAEAARGAIRGGGGAVERIREGASAIGERARRGYDVSSQTVSNAWHEHPLTTGVALLAAGVTIGLLLPGTRREYAVMGASSDAVARRAKSAGRMLVSRGKKVAATVAGALKSEAAVGAAQAVGKVRRIASRVQDVTVSAAKRERLNPVNVITGSGKD